MCQPHPPNGPPHYYVLNEDSIRACIGTLETAVGPERAHSQAGFQDCFDYLRTVSEHFRSYADGGRCIYQSETERESDRVVKEH